MVGRHRRKKVGRNCHISSAAAVPRAQVAGSKFHKFLSVYKGASENIRLRIQVNVASVGKCFVNRCRARARWKNRKMKREGRARAEKEIFMKKSNIID